MCCFCGPSRFSVRLSVFFFLDCIDTSVGASPALVTVRLL